MKTNAIVRIVIYSLVITILLGLLVSGIGVGFLGFLPGLVFEDVFYSASHETRIEATAIPSPLEGTVLTETTRIYEKPDVDSNLEGILDPGSTVYVQREQIIGGQLWGYIDQPEEGWILLERDLEEIPQTTAAATGAGTPVTAFAANEVSSISIDWVAGSITLLPHDGDEILVSEIGDTEKYPMVLYQRNGKLDIQYSKQTVKIIGINSSYEKDLTILVPKDWYCRDLDLDVASSTVLIRNMNIREVDFDGASGTLELTDCTVESIDIDTASGDIHFTGTLSSLDMDAASASFIGILSNTPRSVEIDSMSGGLDLTLPADTGFTVTVEGMNTSFSSDFETSYRNGSHTYGNGACRIEVEGMSSDVIIRKG